MRAHEMLMAFSSLVVALALILLTVWAERPTRVVQTQPRPPVLPVEAGGWNVEGFFRAPA